MINISEIKNPSDEGVLLFNSIYVVYTYDLIGYHLYLHDVFFGALSYLVFGVWNSCILFEFDKIVRIMIERKLR
jgi:hypothetical protein